MVRGKPDWGDIKQDYLNSGGKILLKDLAKKHGVKPTTLRSRKNRENWDAELSGVATQPSATQRKNVSLKKAAKPRIKQEVLEQLEDADLTDMQRLFCLYYVKTFNATQSAIKAGYSADTAHVQGPRLLGNVRVREEIRRLKESMASEILVDAMDVLNQYAKIAFADITDFVEFGQEEVPVMGMYGPVTVKDPETEEKVPLTKIVNTVKFKDSAYIDGQLISEVKQGRDGASIKLLDKMKALEKLEQYFDLIPDTWKRKVEEEKLALERLKVTGDGKGSDREAIKDFVQATTMQVDDVSSLFEDDDYAEE